MKKIVTILVTVIAFGNSVKAEIPHRECIAGTLSIYNFAIDTPSNNQVCNVPITLTNSQNTATSDSFQQMVSVNSSLFSSLEMSHLENIEFTVGSPAPTGTVLQAWIESGDSALATNTIYWVNLDNSIIPANGILVIYMNFMSSSVVSAVGPTGVAPDISGTYAQYDNGGLVFPNVYTRWGGLSSGTLPTTTNGDAINGGNITSVNQSGTMTINNQATYTQVRWNNPNGSTAYPGNMNGVYYTTTPTSSYTYPTVLESKVDIGCTYSWFGTGYGVAEEGWGAVVANDNDGGSRQTYSARSNFNLGNSCSSGNYSYQDWSSLNATNPAAEVWTILLNTDVNDSDQILTEMHNYTSLQGMDQAFPLPIDGKGTTVYQAPCNGGLGTLYGYFGTTQNNPDPQPYEQMYWTRTRVFPPNGVMPTAIVGDTSGGGALAFIFPLDTTICAGASVTLSAVGGLSYTWSNNDTGSVITVTPTTTSLFIVTATNGCGTGSDTAFIKVDTAAVPLIINPPSPTICNGSSITLSVNDNSTAFTWGPSISLNDTIGKSVIATPTATTTYTATGTDSLGCKATGTDTVYVVPAPNKPTITTSITDDSLISSATQGNQWYYNDTLIIGATNQALIIAGQKNGFYTVTVINPANGCSATSDSVSLSGINNLSANNTSFSIYPNPTTGQFTVKLNGNQNGYSIKIFNVLGEEVYGSVLSNSQNTINLITQPDGIYFVYLKSSIGVEVGKVLITR